MKDVMATITAQTLAMRVSKTNVKAWTLYGPIDQALKTSIQAKAVKAHTLTPIINGVPMPLALWVSAEPVYADDSERPNLLAMTMLAVQSMRDRDEEPQVYADPRSGAMMITMDCVLDEVDTPILGPAILTGAGGEGLPEPDMTCIFHTLMGQHD